MNKYSELWDKYKGTKKNTILGRYPALISQEESIDFSKRIQPFLELIAKEKNISIEESVDVFCSCAESFVENNDKNICITEWTIAKACEFLEDDEINIWGVSEAHLLKAREIINKNKLFYDFSSLDNLFFSDLNQINGVLEIN